MSIKKKLFHSSKTLDFFKLGTNPYEMILSLMTNFTSSRDQLSRDEIWIMEHFPIYTIGFKKKHPNENLPFKIIETDRGGDITFHGLGQIVFYTLINLKQIALQRNLTFVASLHQTDFAFTHFSRIVGIKQGKIYFDCSPSKVDDSLIKDLYSS